MDLVEAEEASLAGLVGLVPDEHATHWQDTIEFLKIVTGYWPQHLAEQGLASPGDRRNRLIRAEARRLATNPPAGPVIVAGVTGSIPATVELMRAVLRLPLGAIVLPGLDLALDAESWEAIAPRTGEGAGHPEHPQYGLKRLLDALGATRADVRPLCASAPTPASLARTALLGEVMRPAGTTQLWQAFAGNADRADLAAGLAGISLIEAPTAHDEAEAVALVLREVAETPGRTAALVSPDRVLARRVVQRLEAWGIRVDDLAGRPFGKTAPGAFLDLVIEAAAANFAPAELMALLKHPLCRLGLEPAHVRRAARALEIAAFRTAYLGEGLDGVAAALARAERAVAEARDETQRCAACGRRTGGPRATSSRGCATRSPRSWRRSRKARRGAARPRRRARRRRRGARRSGGTVPSLAGRGRGDRRRPLRGSRRSEHARAAAARDRLRRFLPQPRRARGGALQAPGPPAPLRVGTVRGPPAAAGRAGPRLAQRGDLAGGGRPGPWLNRPMRRALGLPAPEAEIGRSAHDFVSLCGAEQVYLTRAEKQDGAPTVPSRWLMRLKALLGGLGLADALAPEQPWLAWARARDAARRVPPIAAPAPRPPLELRPRKLSVSKVETWISNPYAIFAGSILELEPLPALGEPPGAGLRGSIVHEALSQFALLYPAELPSDPEAELIAIARAILVDYTATPASRRSGCRGSSGSPAGSPRRSHGGARACRGLRRGGRQDRDRGARRPFTLTARADRIDLRGAGLVITDYKTGALPQGQPGVWPAARLSSARGGDRGRGRLPQRRRGPVRGLRYIRASGRRAGRARSARSRMAMWRLAESRARRPDEADRRYDDPATPYVAVRRAGFYYRFDDYAHLARVAEWSAQPEEEGRGMMDLASALARTEALQADAADPDACAWVSANAGTGKTHVLSRRVLRLLLAGTAPERILCLTYTKAAAAEMANRVFDALARWVTLADEELAASLRELVGRDPTPAEMRARAHALCLRDRGAGRAQGADDPRVLRAAAPALPARGRRAAGFHDPRRDRRARPAARRHRRDAARGHQRAGRARSARPCASSSPTPPRTVSTPSWAKPSASGAGSSGVCGSHRRQRSLPPRRRRSTARRWACGPEEPSSHREGTRRGPR